MMTIFSVKEIDVEGHSAVIAKGLEEFLYQLEVEGPDPSSLQLHMKDQPRSHREVQCNRNESLIHRKKGHAISSNPFGLSQSLSERIPEADANIFNGVVSIDNDVALRLERKVDATVVGEEAHHVVEERYAGLDRVPPRPI